MVMASSSSSSSAPPRSSKSLGLWSNAVKNRHSFIQLFAMTGIFLLSVKSLGQKYRIHDLEEDTFALQQEHKTLTERSDKIKSDLLLEASRDPSGLFAARLRCLFAQDQ